MYQKVSTDMNFVAREEEIVKFWRDNQVFKKSVELRKGAPAFTFFDGPPTANGKPHIGHVETRAIKDIMLAGFDDTHEAAVMTPQLTTVRQPSEEIGAIAVRVLTERIAESSMPPREILLPAPLIVRSSTAVTNAAIKGKSRRSKNREENI